MKIKQLIAKWMIILCVLTISMPVQAIDMGFVQCKDGYVNIRDAASKDGKIIGKISNDGLVYISNYMNGWMEIRSGNVKGFIKSDFVTSEGDAIAAIAKTAIHKVACVQPQVLIVRTQPTQESEEIDQIKAGEEVPVIERENGWAKINLPSGQQGYIKEEYVEYRIHYKEAESVQEEESPKEPITIKETSQPVQQSVQVDAPIQVSEPSYEYIPEETTEVEEYVEKSYDYDYEEVYTYDEFEEGAPQEDYNEILYDDNEYQIEEQYDYEEEYDYDYDYEEEILYDDEDSYIEEYDDNDDDVTYYEYVDEDVFEEEEESGESYSSNSGGGKYLSDYAQQYIGNPYVWGGTSLETGADCSGFTMAVLGANGITVNGRTAEDQAHGGTPISLDEAEAGDLIYYEDSGRGIYHIAIYNGDGTVTHSSSTTTGVTVSDMNYSGNASGAVRYW